MAGNPVADAVMAALRIASSEGPAAGVRMLERAGRAVSSDPGALNVLGALQMQAGQTARALKAFDEAVRLAPAFADAHCNRGVILQQAGKNAEALAAYDMAIRHQPGHALALFNRGNVLKLMGRREDAVAAFDAAIAAEPGMVPAYTNRARVRLDLDDLTAALADFDAALKRAPGDLDALNGRAAALMRLGRLGEAGAMMDAIMAAAPANLEAPLLKVGLLIEENKLEEAIALAGRVIDRHGAKATALTARSAALWKLRRNDEAIRDRLEVLRLDPANAAEREALAYMYLTIGDLERGFDAYEARDRRLTAKQREAELGTPRWNGEDIRGKRLLVLTEQGLGDTIQFARYLPMVAAQGATITAVVQPPILSTMRTLQAPVTWSDRQPEGRFDVNVSLMSLPRVFGTRLDTVPADIPYLFADEAKVADWRERLTDRPGFRVGIVWQGNPKNKNDRRRSPPLAAFAPVAAIPGVRLISIQGRNGLDQLAALPAGMAVETLGTRITDNPDGIAEIAGVMRNLDLVIASDTMTVHLAGALGVPVWVALTYDADWRWLRDRDDSPWYPTMRIFRQPAEGDWAGVFAAIASALREEAARRG